LNVHKPPQTEDKWYKNTSSNQSIRCNQKNQRAWRTDRDYHGSLCQLEQQRDTEQQEHSVKCRPCAADPDHRQIHDQHLHRIQSINHQSINQNKLYSTIRRE